MANHHLGTFIHVVACWWFADMVPAIGSRVRMEEEEEEG